MVWEQNCVWPFYNFNFERNYDVLNSKSPCILNKNKNFTEMESKWKLPLTVLERRILCFSSYKNHKLKVKIRWVGPRERKRVHFLYLLFCPKEIFFNIRVLSKCKVYWTHFQNLHTLILKNITSYTFLLVFKIVKSLQCILKWNVLNNRFWYFVCEHLNKSIFNRTKEPFPNYHLKTSIKNSE